MSSDMCACGKNGTAEAHGLQLDAKGEVLHPALSCDQVEQTRRTVARDITREAMNPFQRFTTWIQGRGQEYSAAAYEAAWVPAQVQRVDGAAR